MVVGTHVKMINRMRSLKMIFFMVVSPFVENGSGVLTLFIYAADRAMNN
jgi:hypothetical protein